jgi:hypothetical protein
MRWLAVGGRLADAEFLQRADDLRAHRMAGIERVERILEHHLDRRDGADVALLDAGRLDLLVAERHLAGARGLKAEQHLGERRLAAAGFADDGDGLALARLEADGLVGLDDTPSAPPKTSLAPTL